MALINAIPDASRTIYRELFVEARARPDCGEEAVAFLTTCNGLADVAGVNLAESQTLRAADLAEHTGVKLEDDRVARIQAHLDGSASLPAHLFEIDAALDGEETPLSDAATTFLEHFCGVHALILANTPQAEQKACAERFATDYPGEVDTINGLARKEIKQQRETTT